MQEHFGSRSLLLPPWLVLLRPKQWVKNVFVLPGPLFGHMLLSWDSVGPIGGAFTMFCLLSSAVYVINDVLDVEEDRNHPEKRSRPIASKAISQTAALILAGALIPVACALAFWIGPQLGIVSLLYLANNLAYSLFLKTKIIADVLSIAISFLLRILGGVVSVGLSPSSWLTMCGFCLALFLGFCKRRSEIGRMETGVFLGRTRAVLLVYTVEKLNLLCAIAASLTVMTYLLFTVSPETVARHGTQALIYTAPLVVYCVLRFLMKTLDLQGEDAGEVLLTDRGFVAAGLGWGLLAAGILYYQ